MEFCLCNKFVFWYEGGHGVRVCRCGHPEREHVDQQGSCLGEVIVV